MMIYIAREHPLEEKGHQILVAHILASICIDSLICSAAMMKLSCICGSYLRNILSSCLLLLFR